MKKEVKNILLSIFFSACIFIKINIFETTNITYELLSDINVFGLFITTILSYKFISSINGKLHPLKNILAVFFSICLILSECYITKGSMMLISTNLLTLAATIIKLIGYTFIFRKILIIIDKYFYDFNNKDIKIKNKYLNKYLNLLNNHPFLTSLISILIVWSLYLIAFYPIVLSPDPSNQIKQYFNVETHYVKSVNLINPNILMTAHHPVLHTYLLGWMISLGRFIGSDNLGLFIYTIMQTLILSSTLAYTIKVLKDNKLNTKWLFTILLIYLFVPMYGFYAISAVKDTLYTSFMILFVLFIFDCIKNNKKLNIKSLIYLFILLMLISMLRNNGKYVVVLSMLCLIPYSKINIKRLILTTICFLICFMSYDKVLIPSLGISPTSIRETLSIPFQQTARLVKNYPEFYNSKERKKINKVLKYYSLSTKYNPDLSDPVKNTFRKDAKTKDLINYFKVWFKGLVNHPLIYVDATLNNTYGFISPNAHKWYIYYAFDERITENNLVDYHYNNLGGLRKVLSGYGTFFQYIPLIGLISNIGFGTWIILTFTVYLILSTKRKYLITLVPLYGSLIFCILGPANTYFRYAMPYLFILPALSILLLNEVRGEKHER